jgi:CRP/FNR family cyclic AMP-dependent transcriptional regulator
MRWSDTPPTIARSLAPAKLRVVERARIAAVEIFAGLPESELDVLAEVAFDVEVGAGEALASEGEFGHSVFAIESGTADVIQGERTIRTVGPGNVLGEVAVLSTGRRTASVVATSPMRLIGLFKRDVWALDGKAPAAAQRLRDATEDYSDDPGRPAVRSE